MVIVDSEAGFPWNCNSVVDKIYKTDNYYINVNKRKTGRSNYSEPLIESM